MKRVALVVLCWGCLAASCASPLRQETGAGRAPDASVSGPLAHLAQVSPGIYTGGEPATPEAFDALAAMGVRTIVSVDGARPDLEAARARGMRYVHIPFGYDDVSPAAQAALAHVVRDTEGPVYFHCHHGQHRGPIAAGFGLACAEGVGGDEAAARLANAGYPRKYAALYRELEAFDPATLDPATVESAPLVESADPGTLATAMAAMDRTWDRVLLCRDAGWAAPAGHPDVDPRHEARILAEHFREMNRLMTAGEPEDFRSWMGDAERDAWTLMEAIARADAGGANAALAGVKNSCTACHRAYRD